MNRHTGDEGTFNYSEFVHYRIPTRVPLLSKRANASDIMHCTGYLGMNWGRTSRIAKTIKKLMKTSKSDTLWLKNRSQLACQGRFEQSSTTASTHWIVLQVQIHRAWVAFTRQNGDSSTYNSAGQ